MPDIISASEVTRLLGIHLDTLRRWEREGRLAPTQVEGGKRLYDVSTIYALSETSIRFMVRNRPAKWLFENTENFKTLVENSHCRGQMLIIRQSAVEDVVFGEVTYEMPPLMSRQHEFAYHVQIEDYSQYGRPAGLHVYAPEWHKYTSQEMIEVGSSGWGYVISMWHYLLPFSKTTCLLEEVWKMPHKQWKTEWIYAVVPDALLETKEVIH